MAGKLTTHVLDTAIGKPAKGVRIDLLRGTGSAQEFLKTAYSNADGRIDVPLLEGPAVVPGVYQLVFHVADYHRAVGNLDAGKFLDQVPVVFTIADPAGHYHVPLLVSPWAYSTYRGS